MLFQAADTETLKVVDPQANWRAVLDRVRRGETRVLLEEEGTPVAAIISPDDFDRFRQWEAARQEDLRVLKRSWAAFADVPEDDLERKVERALRKVRAQQRRRATRQTSAMP